MLGDFVELSDEAVAQSRVQPAHRLGMVEQRRNGNHHDAAGAHPFELARQRVKGVITAEGTKRRCHMAQVQLFLHWRVLSSLSRTLVRILELSAAFHICQRRTDAL